MTKSSGYEDLEFVSDFYDSMYNHLARRDIEFFVDYSKKADGKTLELGCGNRPRADSDRKRRLRDYRPRFFTLYASKMP